MPAPRDVVTFPTRPPVELCWRNPCSSCVSMVREWRDNDPGWETLLGDWQGNARPFSVFHSMAHALLLGHQHVLVDHSEYTSLVGVDALALLAGRIAHTAHVDIGGAPLVDTATDESSERRVRSFGRCDCDGNCSHRRDLVDRRSPIPGDPPESYRLYMQGVRTDLGSSVQRSTSAVARAVDILSQPQDPTTWTYTDNSYREHEVVIGSGGDSPVPPPSSEEVSLREMVGPECHAASLGGVFVVSASHPVILDADRWGVFRVWDLPSGERYSETIPVERTTPGATGTDSLIFTTCDGGQYRVDNARLQSLRTDYQGMIAQGAPVTFARARTRRDP